MSADVNWLALSMFCGFVAFTLVVTYWAARRTSTATEFWAAGRGITGSQNGFAIAGDYMSGASLLGTVGLIYLFGFDGIVYMVGFLVAWLAVLFLLAERMRNAGKFTIADVLTFRLRQGPARSATAVATLLIVCSYLVAQMAGAGLLVQVLVGIDYSLSVILTGAIMMIYVIFGGMIATTWLQIIKAVLLLGAGIVLSVFVMSAVGFNPIELFDRAAAASPHGDAYLAPGLYLTNPLSTVSLGLALVLGPAGMPHILMRFFTVPEARSARSSIGWAVALIGAFYVMTTILGFGARAVLGTAGEESAGEGGNLAAPLLAEELGGGAGTTGGSLFLAIIAAVTFATILAVVAGLVISASGAMAHDFWSNVVRGGHGSEREEVLVARIAALLVGAIGIGVAILAQGQNISFIVGLVFAMAASANFPALLLSLTWRRFNTMGAVTGILVGVVSSIVLIVLSPAIWPDPEGAPFPLANPALVSIPLGFLGCYVGTVFSRDPTAEALFDELNVRSQTGLGAEQAVDEETKAVDEAFDARCAIELGVADITVGRLSERELAGLRQRLEVMKPLISNNRFVDFERYLEANADYHEYLVGLANNDTLLTAYKTLSMQGLMARALGGSRESSDKVIEYHVRLTEAYEKGDLQGVKVAIRDYAGISKERARAVREAAKGKAPTPRSPALSSG